MWLCRLRLWVLTPTRAKCESWTDDKPTNERGPALRREDDLLQRFLTCSCLYGEKGYKVIIILGWKETNFFYWFSLFSGIYICYIGKHIYLYICFENTLGKGELKIYSAEYSNLTSKEREYWRVNFPDVKYNRSRQQVHCTHFNSRFLSKEEEFDRVAPDYYNRVTPVRPITGHVLYR